MCTFLWVFKYTRGDKNDTCNDPNKFGNFADTLSRWWGAVGDAMDPVDSAWLWFVIFASSEDCANFCLLELYSILRPSKMRLVGENKKNLRTLGCLDLWCKDCSGTYTLGARALIIKGPLCRIEWHLAIYMLDLICSLQTQRDCIVQWVRSQDLVRVYCWSRDKSCTKLIFSWFDWKMPF